MRIDSKGNLLHQATYTCLPPRPMTDEEFLVAVRMVGDVDGCAPDDYKVEVDKECVERGYDNWQHAYTHLIASKPLPKASDTQTGGTHYLDMSIEPWDVIDTWPLEQQIGFHRGNVLKYSMRMGSKDERLKEAKKIVQCAQKLVEVLERENGLA